MIQGFLNTTLLLFISLFSGETATCMYNSPHEEESLPRVLPGKLLSLDAQCRKDRGTSACFKVGENIGEKNKVQKYVSLRTRESAPSCFASTPALVTASPTDLRLRAPDVETTTYVISSVQIFGIFRGKLVTKT